jgi:acyl-CoA thioesterase I
MLRIVAVVLICLAAAMPVSATESQRIVALGDSLTAGYGLASGDGFTDRLQERLRADGLDVEVINAGVSGDTSKGGLARLDWSVPDGTKLVILELGANDALRGVAPEQTRANLDAMLERLKARNIPVLLAGMIAPPNMGEDYGRQFNPIYAELAQKHDVALYPFFLDGVAGEANLNQADGMHPNAEGIGVIVERIAPQVGQMLSAMKP